MDTIINVGASEALEVLRRRYPIGCQARGYLEGRDELCSVVARSLFIPEPEAGALLDYLVATGPVSFAGREGDKNGGWVVS